MRVGARVDLAPFSYQVGAIARLLQACFGHRDQHVEEHQGGLHVPGREGAVDQRAGAGQVAVAVGFEGEQHGRQFASTRVGSSARCAGRSEVGVAQEL